MNTDMFIPKQLKVGFQERCDTFTGSLGFVTFIDEHGKLRKEGSFESWCDDKIEKKFFDNVPMTGFVMNRKVGGYSNRWNYRDARIRVYDPRGFEIEVSVENQLYILDHMDSIIGKGFSGELIYAWSGNELILLPTNSFEYKETKKKSDDINERQYVKRKDLKVGGTYYTSQKEKMVYLGFFNEYEHHYQSYIASKKSSKRAYFAKIEENESGETIEINTFYSPSKLYGVDDENEHPRFKELFEVLEGDVRYNPIDISRSVLEKMEYKDFKERLERSGYHFDFVAENGKWYGISKTSLTVSGEVPINDELEFSRLYNRVSYSFETYDEVFDIMQPHMTHLYLKNGTYYGKVFATFNN